MSASIREAVRDGKIQGIADMRDETSGRTGQRLVLVLKRDAVPKDISVGEDGASHQCCEDFALMRSIPGMVVINPSDDVEAKAAVEAAYHYQGPIYMRFGRLAVPVINDTPDYKFELGKGVTLRDGDDITIIATEIGRAHV